MASNYAWNDNEILLNEGDPNRYGDLLYEYESGCVTSNINGMENLLVRVPSTSEMEAHGGKYPYSFPCFIQENGATAGTGTTGSQAGGTPTGFTTIMGVDPSIEPWWKNQVSGYTGANIETADSPTGLFAAFDDMLMNVKFEKLKVPQAAKYWEDDNLHKMPSSPARTAGRSSCGSSAQRTTASPWLARRTPRTPTRVSTATPSTTSTTWAQPRLYGTTNSVANTYNTDGSAKTGYPRFYFMNMKYLYPVFHNEKFFEHRNIDGAFRQPFSHVTWIDTYYNIVCRSRRRQGIVYPNVV